MLVLSGYCTAFLLPSLSPPSSRKTVSNLTPSYFC